MANNQAVTVLKVPGLIVNVGSDGVWMHFSSDTKVSASFNMDVMADQSGTLIGRGLKDWCNAQRDIANGQNA